MHGGAMPMPTALRSCLDHFDVVEIRCLPRRRGDASQDRPSQLHAGRRDHGCGRAIQSSTLQILCRLRAQMDRRCYGGCCEPQAMGLADLKDGQLPNFSRPCFPGDGIFDTEADQRGPDGGEDGYLCLRNIRIAR